MNELFKRIFIIHKCVGCHKILDYKDFSEPFCPKCREHYLSKKMEVCPECSAEAHRCRCMPPLLKKDKAVTLRKLFFYSKKKSLEPQNRLIYYLKRNNSKRVNQAVAGELLPLINSELSRLEVNEIPLLVGIPRSKGAFFEYGFDQADLLCRAISSRCGLEYCNALRRRRGGKPQKSLTAGERRKNIKNILYVDKSERDKIKGRTVILLDDVVTTGASMSACIDLLRACGAKNIICIAIASDIKT